MMYNEKFATALEKIEQHEHKQILQQNRKRYVNEKMDLRRKILVGELFINHFPIALEFTPGKSPDEDAHIFKPLDDFIEALSECQQSYQIIEDALLSSH